MYSTSNSNWLNLTPIDLRQPQIHELLSRWATLQPQFCQAKEGFAIFLEGQRFNLRSDVWTSYSSAIVLRTIISLVEAPEASFQLRVENTQNLWHVILAQKFLGVVFSFTDLDPGLAALSTWIEWLEFNREIEY
jgi:hypothetical protein